MTTCDTPNCDNPPVWRGLCEECLERVEEEKQLQD